MSRLPAPCLIYIPLARADAPPGLGKLSWCLDRCFHLVKKSKVSFREKEWGWEKEAVRGLVCITESCWTWFGNSLSLGPESQQFQVSAQRSINKSILPGRSDPLSFHPSPSPWERRLFNGNKVQGTV